MFVFVFAFAVYWCLKSSFPEKYCACDEKTYIINNAAQQVVLYRSTQTYIFRLYMAGAHIRLLSMKNGACVVRVCIPTHSSFSPPQQLEPAALMGSNSFVFARVLFIYSMENLGLAACCPHKYILYVWSRVTSARQCDDDLIPTPLPWESWPLQSFALLFLLCERENVHPAACGENLRAAEIIFSRRKWKIVELTGANLSYLFALPLALEENYRAPKMLEKGGDWDFFAQSWNLWKDVFMVFIKLWISPFNTIPIFFPVDF